MPYCDLRYFSSTLQKQTAAIVLLPDPEIAKPWTTLYLLHGLSDDHTAWTRRTSIERYVEGLNLAVVMPDGGRSFYCDAVEGAAYGKAIGEELPGLVESIFPVRREREGRAVAGLSMGGYGALRLAFTYPHVFRAACSHSGALGFAHEGSKDEDFAREFRRVIGPEPRGGPNDLFALSEKLAGTKSPGPDAFGARLPAFRFDCGVDDHLLRANRAFHEHLDRLAISHVYEEHPGGHNWDYWDEHVRASLRFVTQHMTVDSPPFSADC